MRAAVVTTSLLAAHLLAAGLARGQERLHPPVVVRDREGAPVTSSGRPASPTRTCGECHDTAWIDEHAYHARAGTDEPSTRGARPWDQGPGLFGRWDPLTYDLGASLADRVRTLGPRHVGGGPAQEVGVEHDCFLCHVRGADAAARARALTGGRPAWAATATLSSAGPELRITRPTAAHCGACHGRVHEGDAPLDLAPSVGEAATDTTGQVFSGQRVADSALNLRGKDALLRPWDVHAARMVDCAACHVTPNHPGARDDPRRLDPGEYLRRPSHDLAKGDTAQGTVARRLAGSMRSCEGCHDAATTTHATWLPYAGRHVERLRCEACHVPRGLVPARSEVDWSLLDPETGEGLVRRRGGDLAAWEGFEPVLLARAERDGRVRLGPYNLVTSWYWVGGVPERPVSREQLRAAILDGGADHPAIVLALDRDGDGRLARDERRLDSAARVEAVRARLLAAGVVAPRLVGEVQPYGLHHGVAAGAYALRECDACHTPGGRLDRPFVLSAAPPHGVTPTVVSDAGLALPPLERDAQGTLVVRPSTADAGAWVVGHDRAPWVDALGAALVVVTLVAASAHGVGRVIAARRSS